LELRLSTRDHKRAFVVQLKLIQEGGWITGPSPENQKKADQLQAEIDALSDKVSLDSDKLLIPYIKVRLERLD
jgi:hypothetical protein